GVPVHDPRKLTSKQVATLADWAKAGGQLDVPREQKLVAPKPPKGTVIRHDKTIRMPEPYVGTGTAANDYRCIVFDPKFTERTYVTGTEFVPGTPSVVHHAILYRVDARAHDATLAKSGVDGRPGWNCNLGADVSLAGVGARGDRARGAGANRGA